MLQKYFIAIVPPEPLLVEIQKIKKDIFESFQTKGALLSPGHITLHMPFRWQEKKEDQLISCLQTFQIESSFEILLKNFSCFEPRVIFINVEPNNSLTQLQKNLVQHTKKNLQLFNQSDDMRGFHPHITIAFRDLKKQTFYRVWEEYKHKFFDSTFTCTSICLLKQNIQDWEVCKEFKVTT